MYLNHSYLFLFFISLKYFIDLAQNKLKEIIGLKHLTNLRKLDLGANRIRVMDEDELSSLVNLENLWLGKNKIEKVEGISKVKQI